MDVGPIAAPPLLGFFINICLFGVLIVQVYIYYLGFPGDRASSKALVFGVFALEIAQTMILLHDKYQTYAVNFGNIANLDNGRLSWFAVPVMTAVTSGIVQGYFGYRIMVLSRSKPLAILVWTVTALQCAAGIAQGAQSMPLTLSLVHEKTKRTLMTWFISSAVNDILIAAALSYYLNTMRTGFDKTDVLLTRLIHLIVETGILTAVIGVLIVILFFGIPTAPWFLIFTDSIGKVYANNMMVMFNSRLKMRPMGQTTMHSSVNQTGGEVHLSTFAASPAANNSHFGGRTYNTDASTVYVTTTTEKGWHGDQDPTKSGMSQV